MIRSAFSLIAVLTLGLALSACIVTAADAAPAMASMAGAAASIDPGWAVTSLASSAAGATAVSSLQASDDLAGAVAVAPRVTLADLEAKIVREQTHVFDGVLTVHVLTMENGFTITGESACASPENFNAELGVKFAREQAIRKAWAFEGYALRERLSRG